eukprot:5723648-Pleurochrysis_carterae.AAC.1
MTAQEISGQCRRFSSERAVSYQHLWAGVLRLVMRSVRGAGHERASCGEADFVDSVRSQSPRPSRSISSSRSTSRECST